MSRASAIFFLLFPCLAHALDVEVNISGLEEGQLRDNALAFLGIYQYRDREDLTEAMIRRLHARAPDELRRALMPFGHYRTEVEASLRREGDTWYAEYRVDRGPPVRVANIDIRIRGAENARRLFDDIINEPPIREGEILRHAQYETLKTALMNRATERGYLDATFGVQRLAVNTDTLEAKIELELETGPRYYFGEVAIEQARDILDEDFVRRFIDFETGEPLNYAKLLDLQYALTDSEYYSVVQVEALRELAGDDRRVPILIRAEPNERTRYAFGLGYGTDTGPRVSVGMQRRYVNRRGHRFEAEAKVAEIEDSFSMRYTIPLEEPAQESFQLFAGTIHAERADTESDRLVFGISRIRTLGEWDQTLYLRAEREDSTVPGDSFRTESLIPGASWQKTAADDLFYTRNGYRIYADLHGSASALGAETEYAQLHVLGKRIWSLGDRWRLLLRAEAGATVLGKTSRLPVSQRFFAGGDYSVRGFDYNSIGPPDDSGNVVGGQYLATGSAEIDYRFAKSWAVAAFVDAGNAMNDVDEELKRAYGVGVRWISPVGVVRFDIAKPLNADPPPPRGIEIHISVGPDL